MHLGHPHITFSPQNPHENRACFTSCSPKSIPDGLARAKRLMAEAAAQGATIVCFPEAYLPGLRGLDFDIPAFDQEAHDLVYTQVQAWASDLGIATIMGMERITPEGRQIVAYVFDAAGNALGYQTKNQLDPSEETNYIHGHERHIFEADGLRFGIAICHEGWRYPETVRWAARKGAHIVFPSPAHRGNKKRYRTHLMGGHRCTIL